MSSKTLAAVALAATLLLPTSAEALQADELLGLVAMPLAVAAVSEVTDMPMSELIDVVTLLNDAAVPPAQFVEVVRYAPVALVVEPVAGDQLPVAGAVASVPVRTPFVQFVRTQYEQGVVGIPLVTAIEREIREYGVSDVELDVIAAPSYELVDDDAFIPAPVRTRLAEQRSGHPHGGPPGQLKNERGLQTGAEVVHGQRRAKRHIDDDDRAERHVAKQAKRERPAKLAKRERVDAPRREPKVAKATKVKVQKQEHHGGGGHGGGGGKGKGKGKG